MATNWVTITVDDLRKSKASVLIDAFQSAALGEGQADPVPETIADVCRTIRSKIGNSGKYHVSATEDTIPRGLKRMALRLIIWDLQGRPNVLNVLPPTNQDEIDHRNDLAELERIASGNSAIETPSDPLTTPDVQSGGMVQTVQEGNSGNSREELSRL